MADHRGGPVVATRPIARVKRGLEKYGFRGGLRHAGSRAAEAAGYLRETHIWYELDLTRARPRREMPAGLELIVARPENVGLLDELPRQPYGPGGFYLPTVRQAEERLADGAVLWLVVESQRPAFACWIFPQRAPLLAAPGGWLELPPGVVCLEDSVTSEHYRGRGVAPAAWSGIADRLSGESATAMITKVEEDNAASRRAVEKAGFREIAMMSLLRIGSRSRVVVRGSGQGTAGYLANRLACGPGHAG